MNNVKTRNNKVDFNYFYEYLKKRKKYFIIIIIIGILAGSILTVYYSKKNQASYVDTNQQAINTARGVLGANEVKHVDSAFESYQSLMENIEKLKDFQKNSVYLQLNEKSSVGREYMYNLSGENVSAIFKNTQEMLTDKKVYDKINSDLKKSKEKTITYLDFCYLIQLNAISEDVNNDSKELNLLSETNDTRSKKIKVMVIKVYAKNNTQLNIMCNSLQQKFESVKKKLSAKYNYSVQLINDKQIKVDEGQIMGQKVNIANQIQQCASTITSLQSTLTEDERTYFDALVAGNDKNSTQIKSATSGNGFSIKSLLKNIILLEIAFNCVFICILLIKYVTSGLIYSSNEAVSVFGVNNIFEVDDNLSDRSIQELKYFISNSTYGFVDLTSNNQSSKLLQSISKENLGTILKKFPETSNDFEALKKIDHVILIVGLGKTHFKMIQEVIAYYSRFNIEINGMVTIK